LNPTPELRWVLHRAFAAPDAPAPPPGDPSSAFDLATRLDLAPRIAARAGATLLTAEVGPIAATFTRTLHLTAASALLHQHTLKVVASLAESRGISLVILKGCAMGLLGISSPGARGFCDLDILVAVDRIPEMTAALVEAGWKLAPFLPSELHVPGLSHPSLGTIELHRCVLGVRVPGSRRSIDGLSMDAVGLTQTVPTFNGTVRAPSIPVLTAHALVHGLVQHGYLPAFYPLFRLLADLQDLVAAGADLQDAIPFLGEIDANDLDAVETLLKALGEGTALDLPPGPPRTVLAHLVAGSLDLHYRVALKSDPRSVLGLTDLPLPVLVLRRVSQALFLSRARVDAIYGRPKRQSGYLARQVFRPVDLVLQLGSSIWARLNASREAH
jgi:hypothetical protein